jgi:hypothetical protein
MISHLLPRFTTTKDAAEDPDLSIVSSEFRGAGY